MDSVQNQSLVDWEHLIIDDGSKDGTSEEVIHRARMDSRIRYIRRTGERSGANVCRNQGLRESRADLIVFLDSDDLLDSKCLIRRVEVMERNHDIDFATFQAGIFRHVVGDAGRVMDPELIGDDLLRFLFFECPWQTSAPIWRRTTLIRLEGFDETLLSWQDIDLHIRALTTGTRYLRFSEVDHHLRWREGPGRVSFDQRRSTSHLEAVPNILENFERVVRQGQGMNWMRQRALCSLYFFAAECWLEMGYFAAALKTWWLIRERSLGSLSLHGSGAVLLVLYAIGVPCTRLLNKWKGWMRLRTNAELVPP